MLKKFVGLWTITYSYLTGDGSIDKKASEDKKK